MLTEKEFIKNCNIPLGACGHSPTSKYCEFYDQCVKIREWLRANLDATEYNDDNYQIVVYKEFVKLWRKQKLSKLLSQ